MDSGDWVAIACAVITGLLSLAGVFAANKKSSALIAYRIEELEKKQDKHNNMIERVYKVEERVTGLEHDIKHLKGD